MTDLNREARQIRRPSLALLLLEPFRATFELAELAGTAPFVAKTCGDGHAVLVIPGFAMTDLTTAILRHYLRSLGYRAEGWKLGRNNGYRILGEDQIRLRDRAYELYEQSGRKISVVGWSMGGVMARRLACLEPDIVRQVVTLGAPFTGNPRAITIRGIYEAISGERLDSAKGQQRFHRDEAQPPVPTTAIYTKTDGITAWRNCVGDEGPLAESIAVPGSHAGLVVNPTVFGLLADRLAQPEGQWRPYETSERLAVGKPYPVVP